jgi:predicted aldo/keto reductase-like oxidoreductase
MALAREACLSLAAIPCTRCRYSIAARWTERWCMPCPQGVAIPDVLGTSNEAKMFGDVGRARMLYNWLDEKTQGGGVPRVR